MGDGYSRLERLGLLVGRPWLRAWSWITNRVEDDGRVWWHDKTTLLIDPGEDETISSRDLGENDHRLRDFPGDMWLLTGLGGMIYATTSLIGIMEPGAPTVAMAQRSLLFLAVSLAAVGAFYLWITVAPREDLRAELATTTATEPVRDRYLAGEIDEAELEKEVEPELEVDR